LVIVAIALFLIVGVLAAWMMIQDDYWKAPIYERDPETGEWDDKA
jgi:hypothetical protein